MNNKVIWITWENQRRNRELSKALNAELFEFPEIDKIKNPLRKYSRGIYKTIKVLFKFRPHLVYIQNPSLILSVLVITLKNIMRFKVLVDAHNIGLLPENFLLIWLSRYIQRKADLVIVSNSGLKSLVESNGGKSFVLPDRIPEFDQHSKKELQGDLKILFICSFAPDEPYEEVIEAGRLIDSNIKIYVTGDYRRRNLRPENMPVNIILTGYLPENEYVAMLQSADAVIDLTTRENCLVCGAYESLAVGKPLILSNSRALKEYFYKGVIFTPNTADGIAHSIKEMLCQKEILSGQITALKEQRFKEWEKMKNDLLTLQESFLTFKD